MLKHQATKTVITLWSNASRFSWPVSMPLPSGLRAIEWVSTHVEQSHCSTISCKQHKQ